MAGSSITVTVHRGSNEIGGNCVEIATAKSRLILDVGMPLAEMMDANASRRRKPKRDDLIRRGVILPIRGLFSPGPEIDGILLSHAHVDHFGLIEYTRPEIPVHFQSRSQQDAHGRLPVCGTAWCVQGAEKEDAPWSTNFLVIQQIGIALVRRLPSRQGPSKTPPDRIKLKKPHEVSQSLLLRHLCAEPYSDRPLLSI
jgi:glyoxylase-like metal-dependent hydrolase (beta-lactamase superfamily II)